MRAGSLFSVVVIAVVAAGSCTDGDASGWTGERVEARPVERPAGAAVSVDRLCVDTLRSRIRWRGTKAGGGSHEGLVRIAGGELSMNRGEIVGGGFTVDMRTIAVTDIPPHEVEARRQLREHLAHEEFFGVGRFPTASFTITDVEGGEHRLYRVSGNLAIRDSVHNVTFEASAPVVRPDGLWATAAFTFDRQRWGIDFDGTTSALRNAIVHDGIQLRLEVVADRASCGSIRGARGHPPAGGDSGSRDGARPREGVTR